MALHSLSIRVVIISLVLFLAPGVKSSSLFDFIKFYWHTARPLPLRLIMASLVLELQLSAVILAHTSETTRPAKPKVCTALSDLLWRSVLISAPEQRSVRAGPESHPLLHAPGPSGKILLYQPFPMCLAQCWAWPVLISFSHPTSAESSLATGGTQGPGEGH